MVGPPGNGVPLLSVDEFLDWAKRPENRTGRLELDEGIVCERPQATARHNYYIWLLVRILTSYALQAQTGFVLTDQTGLVLSRADRVVRRAGVAFVARRPGRLDRPLEYLEEPPALVAEVVRRGDRLKPLYRRLAQYLRYGVPWVWVVQPDERCVAEYRPGEFPRVHDETDVLSGEGVLAGFARGAWELLALPRPFGASDPVPAPARPG